METMIKCGYLLLIALLITWAVSATEITTGNLLPNGTSNASSYQNVDNTIPAVSTNGFICLQGPHHFALKNLTFVAIIYSLFQVQDLIP